MSFDLDTHGISLMKVVSYLKTVPGKNINPQKEQLLFNFAEGVRQAGDEGLVHTQENLILQQ